jgi:hypothetical protein
MFEIRNPGVRIKNRGISGRPFDMPYEAGSLSILDSEFCIREYSP